MKYANVTLYLRLKAWGLAACNRSQLHWSVVSRWQASRSDQWWPCLFHI